MTTRYLDISRILLFFLLLFTTLLAENISIKATVNSTNITLNDLVSYTVEIQGKTRISDIPAPQGKNFSIVSGPMQSSNIQIINGKMESKKSFTWKLQPLQEGQLVVNGFSVVIDKKKYSADRVEVKVSAARYKSGNRESNQQLNEGGQVFLDAVVSKKSAYLGEQVVVEYKLIYNARITNYGLDKLPTAKGFWVEEFPEIRNPQSHKIVIDGVEYMSATIKRIALFPTATGKLQVEPLSIQCEVVMPQAKRRSNSRFDSFFDDPFFGNSIFDRTKVKRIVSQPLTIDVKPLPEFLLSDTLPCVMENVTISGEVDTIEILKNKALTLKYLLSGYGNINAVNLDKPDLPEHVEIFPPKVNKVTNNRGAKIKGTATYEYVLIPHQTGELNIPPLDFVYFDSERQDYKTLTAKGFKINVLEDKNQITVNSGLNKEEIRLLDQDIRYIMKDDVKWQKPAATFYTDAKFIIINLFSLIFVAMSIAVKVFRKTLGNNPALMRKNRAGKKAREKLSRAMELLEKDQPAEALAKFDSVIAGFMSDRLSLPEAGLGPDDYQRKLEHQKIDEKLIREVRRFLEKMEMYRYSPGALGKEDYQKIYNECKTLLTKLSKVI